MKIYCKLYNGNKCIERRFCVKKFILFYSFFYLLSNVFDYGYNLFLKVKIVVIIRRRVEKVNR